MKYLTLLFIFALSNTAAAGWEVASFKNKMEDSTEITVELKSKNLFKGKHAKLDLFLECGREDRLSILVSHPDFLNVTLPVHVRFDKEEQKSIGSSIGSDYKSYHLGSGSRPRDISSDEFFEKLKTTDNLMISYFDSNGIALIPEFNVKALDKALKKKDTICSKSK